MFLWVDDIRTPPSDKYVWVQSTDSAVDAIYDCHRNHPGEVIVIDLDHDSGDFFPQGGDYIRILDWLEIHGVDDVIIHLHTMNPVGRDNMRRIIRRNGWKEIY